MPSSKWVSFTTVGRILWPSEVKKTNLNMRIIPTNLITHKINSIHMKLMVMIKIVHLFFGNSMFDLPFCIGGLARFQTSSSLQKRKNYIYQSNLRCIVNACWYFYFKKKPIPSHRVVAKAGPPWTTAPSMESPPIVSPWRFWTKLEKHPLGIANSWVSFRYRVCHNDLKQPSKIGETLHHQGTIPVNL